MTRTYKPRRASARWLDADCPAGVLAIFDHPRCGDRYTVIYADPVCGSTYSDTVLTYVAASASPFHPQGIGQHGEMSAPEVAAYRYAQKHRYAKWSALPDDVKKLVRQDLAS